MTVEDPFGWGRRPRFWITLTVVLTGGALTLVIACSDPVPQDVRRVPRPASLQYYYDSLGTNGDGDSFGVFMDPDTDCQYVVFSGNGGARSITPRLDTTGNPICRSRGVAP